MNDTGKIAEQFVLSSAAWLGVGTILAAYFMIAKPGLGVSTPLKYAHAHAMLIGFIAMMIFGVAYRMLPLPPLLGTGGLYSIDLARYHLYIANISLAGMVLIGILMPILPSVGTVGLAVKGLMAAFGLLQVVGMFMYIYNLYKTLQLKENDLPFGGGKGPGGPGPGPR